MEGLSKNLSDQTFYDHVPVFEGFSKVVNPAHYRPVPEDWFLGLADVVSSTQAIAEGSYKTVNMAGAAIIAAVKNALQGGDFPFIFGGDGASFAVSAGDAPLARQALSRTAAWVRDDLGLELRVALVPVAATREQGLDVRVARFAPSPDVSYAMFSGGGLAWAERQMKQGHFSIGPGAAGERPDLTGLSCRWEEAKAARGVILSLIVKPVSEGDLASFRTLVETLVQRIAESPEAGRPVPESGLHARRSTLGARLETLASSRSKRFFHLQWSKVFLHSLLSAAIFKFNIPVGRFKPKAYLREMIGNSDFRKYDDRLLMTIDCTEHLAGQIEDLLLSAQSTGIATYGIHRQASVHVTCVVPSLDRSDHVHFIDGAGGGYAAAAKAMKVTAHSA